LGSDPVTEPDSDKTPAGQHELHPSGDVTAIKARPHGWRDATPH